MIYNILLASLFCVGLNLIIDTLLEHWTGYNLHWYENHMKPIWQKVCNPLFLCVICMSSVWGTATYYFLNQGIDIKLMFHIPGVALVNWIIKSKFNWE